MTERTLVLVKPDGVQRGLIGEVLSRIERKGFQIDALTMVHASREMLVKHYAEHEGKPFFEPLIDFMSEGPTVAIIASGEEIIEAFRIMAGATNPTTADPGSIRGDYGRNWGTTVVKNIVHGSDSTLSAEREISIWFPEFSE